MSEASSRRHGPSESARQEAREEAGVKVRQPLGRLLCVVPEVHRARVEALLPAGRIDVTLEAVGETTRKITIATTSSLPGME